MRTKPLNPNSMQMIMENFRKYQSVLKEQFGDHDNKIYLVEGKNKTPSHIQMDELIQRLDEGKYTESQVLKIWERSFDYEAQEAYKLFEEHLLQEQDEEAEAPGGDVKVPKWLEALGNMFNKGLGMLGKVIDKGIAMVVGVATKIFNFIARFKEKHPVMFKIIIAVIVAALALAVLYVMAEFLQGLLENSNIEKVGIEAPLCGDGLSEEVGMCMTIHGAAGGGGGSPKMLTEEQYKSSMGLLESIKQQKLNQGNEGSYQLAQSAQTGLTSCYEGAQQGEVLQLGKIAGGAKESGNVIEMALEVVNKAKEGENPFGDGTQVLAPDRGGFDDANQALDRWSRFSRKALEEIDQRADVLRNMGSRNDLESGLSAMDSSMRTDDETISAANKMVSDALEGGRGEQKQAARALEKAMAMDTAPTTRDHLERLLAKLK